MSLGNMGSGGFMSKRRSTVGTTEPYLTDVTASRDNAQY